MNKVAHTHKTITTIPQIDRVKLAYFKSLSFEDFELDEGKNEV